MEANRPAHRFAAALAAIAAPAGLLVAWWAADRGRRGDTIFGAFAPLVESLIAAGAASVDGIGAAMLALRLPIACAAAIALVWVARRPVAERGGWPIALALALGGSGQGFLLGGFIGVGWMLYAAAMCAVFLAARQAPASVPIDPAREGAAIIALLALFAVLCLYRIEVDPDLNVDEMAYLRAARMFAGQVDVGRILGHGDYQVYVYEQFQAQAIPLALQAAAVSLLPSDVIATRLVSVLAVGAALLAAVFVLRRALGPRTALWMLALGTSAPLVVVYSRAGHYISISLLHGVLSFASLLWLWRRWDLPAAVVTGALLGASLYQYQLSWFVPVFALAAFGLTPSLWRRAGVLRVGAAVGITGVAVALPAWIWLGTGLAAVNAQTFDDRAAWNEPGADEPPSPHETWTGVVAIAPTPIGVEERAAIDARVARRELSVRHEHTTQGESVAWIGGRRPAVGELAEELRREGWTVLDFDWITTDPVTRVGTMLRQLFYERSFESSGRWIDAPLLDPLLAPLLVLGIAMAWRRRDEPAIRLMLIWVIGGALLPAAAGGPAPRRTTLMLPFAYALAALPLVALGGAAAKRGRAAQRVAAGAALAFFAVATASGSHLYFREWQHRAGRVGGGGDLLHLVKVLKGRPPDEVILMPAVFPGFENYLDAGSATVPLPHPDVRRVGTLPALAVLARSCERPPPFTWMFRDVPGQRASTKLLETHFEVREEVREGIRILRVTAARGDICRRLPRPSNPSPPDS